MAFDLRSVFLFCAISGLVSVGNKRTREEKDKDKYCPKGWTQLDKRCFVFQDIQRVFPDAESVCNIFGGNLASIRSSLEYALVLQLIAECTSDPGDDVWIGLHEALGDGSFVWTDGTKVGFTAFNTNNNTGNCIEIETNDNLWDNDSCMDENRFVCAKDVDKCDQCEH
ncbi:struthiocalcin-2-like isoform X2 [Syngnathus acus]|uniref:struthiocalcin-2-like isoform X2 n=1 Tax=Syngnathus acus TaxID=161584 RepID=UPI001885D630|nr:struthiocalcin-2-like isoform X2 [Syngnathus acus]